MFKHQVRSQIFSLIIFATVSHSSLCFAQMANDGYEYRTGGIFRQVASLQNTVVQRNGPAPVYAYDDTTGKQTCIWNCDQEGDSGVARRYDVKVIGADERRSAAATTYTEAERKKYSSIGRIECPTKRGSIAFGTGFNVVQFDVMVTAAHVFNDPIDGTDLEPTSCKAVYYNSDGSVRESIGIELVRSRWKDPRLKDDPSNDIAIIKLVRASTTAEVASALVTEYKFEKTSPVKMVGFHGDMPSLSETRTLRNMAGVAIDAPPNNTHALFAQKNSKPFNNPENLAVASYDSNHGTSGAPVYNSAGKIIGFNQGAAGVPGAEFDSRTSYNLVIKFDARFASDLRAILALP